MLQSRRCERWRGIPGARLIEFPGNSHFFGPGPKDDEINTAIQEFVTGERPVPTIDRLLTTVMFTDVVGSTERAAEIGDRAWRELLAQHHSLVRSELKRFQGREIDLPGTASSQHSTGPARAVRAAQAITAGVGSIGLEVRAGVHPARSSGRATTSVESRSTSARESRLSPIRRRYSSRRPSRTSLRDRDSYSRTQENTS